MIAQTGHFALVTVSTGQSTGEVVTVEDLREHLRLQSSTEDALVEQKIGTAVRRIQGRTSRDLLRNKYDLMIDAFPSDQSPIRIPRMPLVSVDSVTYYDTDGVAQSFSSSGYFVDTYSEPGRLCLQTGNTWPSATRDYVAGVIRFTAGYSTSASGIPNPLVEAVKKLATELYENREAVSLGNSVNEPLPYGIDELLSEYLMPEFF